jgi:hypothetical protein
MGVNVVSHINGATKINAARDSVMRRIDWPKGKEIRARWRKLHNEDFKDLYSSPILLE